MKGLALIQLRRMALELNASERAELAHDLLASLDGAPDLGAADAWDAEAMRRLAQIDDGAVQPLDRAELAYRMRQQFIVD